MTETIICHVTGDHITNGAIGSSRCPIALSLREQFPNKIIGVGLIAVRIGLEEYKTSRAAVRFIDAFDSEQIVSPTPFCFRKIT